MTSRLRPVADGARLRLVQSAANEAGIAPPPVIVFDGVSLDIEGDRVLQAVSLEVRRGEIVCLVGGAGAGKTQLLRLLAGLETPTSGEVRREGRRVRGPSREVALMFAEGFRSLLPWRSALGNVSLALEAAGLPRLQRRTQAQALLEKVGVADVARHFPAQLTPVQRQRVQLARCLAQSPSVLLLDAPFGGLDTSERHALQDDLAQIAFERELTVLLATRDVDEAVYLGDTVLALRPRPGERHSVAQRIEIALERPRDPVATRDEAAFVRLRRLAQHTVDESA